MPKKKGQWRITSSRPNFATLYRSDSQTFKLHSIHQCNLREKELAIMVSGFHQFEVT